MNADHRFSLLSLVRPAIDATLNKVLQATAKHAAQPGGNAALTDAPVHLHQIVGALRTARRGTARNSKRPCAIPCAPPPLIRRKSKASAAASASFANSSAKPKPAARACRCACIPHIANWRASAATNRPAKKTFLFQRRRTPPIRRPHTPNRARSRPGVLPALLKELRSRYQRSLLG